MQASDRLNAGSKASAQLVMGEALLDRLLAHGRFKANLVRDGNVIWEDDFPNTVMTVGKNAMEDHYLAASAFTQTGPYMGLVSSASYSAISAADTMTSHAGWLEAGNAHAPTYSGNRPTCVWSAASAGSKALSAALNFTFTGAGTVKGCFITLDASAVNTIDNTAGTLFSAGLFTGGDRAVLTSDQLNVSYSFGM